jgi:5-methylthioadenosine/S-adenosylhomocysteine deaminase
MALKHGTDLAASRPEPVDLVVRAGFLYPVDGERDVILEAEVAVRNGVIVYAGTSRPHGHWQAREYVDRPSHALLPGFVNCHCHTASTVFRSQTDDGAGGGALYSIAFRGESRIADEDWRRLAVLGTVEMIRAGFTTLNDFWYAPDAMAETALATGLRVEIGTEIVDVDKTGLAAGDYTRDSRIGERTLRLGAAVAERWHGTADGLITARLGPHATDTCSGGLLREIAAEARRLGIGLHCHVAQSRQEAEVIRASHGVGPAAWLAELGVLGPEWVLAHLTFADAADRAAVAQAGAGYAHCATIYPRRGVYPDLMAIRAEGIRTGLATDWMMNDPFEAMRSALNAVRLRQGSHEALNTMEALQMATAGAAEAMGMGGRIGRLTPGREADMILVDLDQPHLQPFYGEPASLVYYARAADVRWSIVRGRVIMRDGEIPGTDAAAALREVKGRALHLGAMMRELGGASRLPACPCGMH